MLIGNFMKTILHGKLKSRTPALNPCFEPYVPKYADNGRAKSKTELNSYFREYRKRTDYNAIFSDFILKKFEERSKNVFRYYFPESSTMYQTAKRVYHAVRRNF
jgi:hypothetical protein